MKLSVIVTVFNNGKYISECISSILSQNYDDYELIIVDDGSKDNSINICGEYATASDKVVHITQSNSGVSSARNAGIELAKGDYIVFVDGDDFLEDGALATIAEYVTKTRCDVLSYQWYLVKNGVQISSPIKKVKTEYFADEDGKAEIYGELLDSCAFGSAVLKAVKRNFLNEKNIRFDTNVNFYEDQHFVIDLYTNCTSGYFLSKRLYNYRRDSQGMTANFSPDRLRQLELLVEKLDNEKLRAAVPDYQKRLKNRIANELITEAVSLPYLKTIDGHTKQVKLQSQDTKAMKEYIDQIIDSPLISKAKPAEIGKKPMYKQVWRLLNKKDSKKVVKKILFRWKMQGFYSKIKGTFN